jgi:diguanylate cyclase (GGDEF)-like protein
MLIRLNATLRRVPRWSIVVGSLLYTAVVAWTDYRIGTSLPMAVFYLPPIVAVSWFLGRSAGLLFVLLSAAAGSLLERIAGASTRLLLWNGASQLLFFLVVAALVSVLAEQTVQLRTLAREDPLTGIPNRRAFFGALDRALEWSRRQGVPWVLAYLDVDNFKKINDTRGHGVGDAVLQQVARTLREGTRRIDVVARLGGDEFALLLPNTDAGEAETVINKLLAVLEEAMASNGFEVSFSIGVVTFAAPPDSLDTAVAMADACMYRVKARGKAGAVFRIWPAQAALELPRGVAAAARMGR